MTDQSHISITNCPICNSTDFRIMGKRIDNVNVIQCNQCKMGFVETYPKNLDDYYRGDYYEAASSSETGIGYIDYDFVAAHSLSWVVYFIRMLYSSGRVLDIGCANGYLLKQLGTPFDLYGIEVNEAMIQECQAANITIIGRDVNDPEVAHNYHTSFDIISAIAVLEHVTDMKSAIQQIKSMMTPQGIFIFEVPLISDKNNNDCWYNSSLEHIYYPTIASLQKLFKEVFQLPLIGGEFVIGENCSTFVGLISTDTHVHQQLVELYNQLYTGPIPTLHNTHERTFRYLFDVIHAARKDTEVIGLLPLVDHNMLNTGILERIAKLWSDDIQQKQGWMLEAENVQLLQLQSTHWIASLEEGKVWLEEQLESFKHALHTSDTIINEQKSWISTLEEDRNYHIQQAENWQSEAHFWQQQAQGLEKYHAGAVEEGAVLRTERDALITERDALSAECDALSAERDALLRYNPIARMQRSMKKRRLHKKV